jgi:predicted unusual protein kinase regulating ubiquinone biosynthesis (AarF/ABC1/UbiB family)
MDARGDPHFVFLDCGIVFSSKTEREHQALVDVCLAFMRHDGIRAGELIMDRNEIRYRHMSEQQRRNNKAAFCNGLQKMIDDSEHELFYEHFDAYVARICELARTFSIKLDPTYFQVAMALKIMEGVSLSLNKELDLISKCVPIVVKAQAFRKLGILKFPEESDTIEK